MINYRLASSGDNLQLIELTASTGMMGETSLRIDRKPDFFKLLEKRGKTSVFVAVEDNRIVGSLCVSLQEVYVGGQVLPLYYIGDFKVAASHRKMGIGLRLCDELANCIIPEGADLAFLNVAKGNKQPFSFFKNRTNIPDFENIGTFKIRQFVGKRIAITRPLYKIEESPVSEELLKFLNGYYGKYELGAVITKEKLEESQIFIIKNENEGISIAARVVAKLSERVLREMLASRFGRT
jgi:ribosomal protein S18 acetylase RimI-like enzyme